ncbi:MAG: hypothetical protein CO145_01985 [Candidatus Nealsonbacteria bacterium CG_4_9_14_3_um_filter_37_13]|uniref:ATP synthase gamma chain n=1 Tax=Candidatus Nealsonbacteria bacterium CG_4_9_14_3_um_filter_37_13 TaxID=1974695 RepID=A0A2M7Z4S9_9BACT|nr:MAG: hypothetical protein CO145_01985 [Candidatus Nealsonbacteria bacterium CG_4_9_14_3_um_filter_37_13]
MPILKKIKEDLKAVSNIETITRTYQEIANLRMNEIRQKVLNNREFIEELSQVYTLAKKAYLVLLKKEKPFIKRKGERVVVFLSGNERFYGTLFSDIWRELLNYLAKNKADLAVVGRMGKYLAERSGFGHKMFYFELNDDKPEKNRLRGIIDFIKNYEEIIIFHGRFQTILSQKVVQSNISGGVTLEEELEEVKSYLFEPSPEAVLEFFETELLSAFFNQTILEHRLSKYAARMVAMYQATENAKKRERKLKIEQKKIERQLLNRKQIELFSGSQLWT